MFGSKKIRHESYVLCDPVSAATAVVSTVVGSQINQALAPSPQQAQQAVDPFAPYRPQYGQQLNQLMQNPSSVQNLPGFQAELNLANQTIQRQAAQTGQTQSGAELIQLQNQSALLQNQFFQQQLQNLATLSGAAQSPAQGGQAAVSQANQGVSNTMGLAGLTTPMIQQGLQSALSTPTAQTTQVDPGVANYFSGTPTNVGGYQPMSNVSSYM